MARIKDRNPAETRAKVLDAFVKLCSEIGITQVTLQKVADKANLAFASVRYHFAEKGTNLEYEAALFVLQAGQEFTQKYIDSERRKKDFNPLRAYIDATFEWIENYPAQSKYLLYFYYVSGTKQELPVRNDAMVSTARVRTVGLIHECIGSGQFKGKRSGDFARLAEEIHSVLFGCGTLAMSVSKKDEFKRQRENAWDMTQKLMESEGR